MSNIRFADLHLKAGTINFYNLLCAAVLLLDTGENAEIELHDTLVVTKHQQLLLDRIMV